MVAATSNSIDDDLHFFTFLNWAVMTKIHPCDYQRYFAALRVDGKNEGRYAC